MSLFKRKKKTAPLTSPTVEKEAPIFTRLLPGREYGDLAHDDAELRFWLPEVCRTALDEVTNALDVTEAFWLRGVFMMHLYGEHEYRRMFAQKADFFTSPRVVSRKSSRYAVAFSVAPQNSDGPLPEPTTWVAPNLGKNMWPIKVFVPGQLKRDLLHAAARNGIMLSVYARELLLMRLLGYALDRNSLLHCSLESLNAGEKWESGDANDMEVPVSKVPATGPEITYLND